MSLMSLLICHSVRYMSCWNKRLLTYLLT